MIDFQKRAAITKDQLRLYAKASGDFNPIHLSEDVAKKSGLPGIIAHGMISAAFLAERAIQFVESQPSLQGFYMSRIQSRFKAMVLLGDVIAVGGTVKEMTEDSIVLSLQAKNQRGESVTLGTAYFSKSP